MHRETAFPFRRTLNLYPAFHREAARSARLLQKYANNCCLNTVSGFITATRSITVMKPCRLRISMTLYLQVK